MVDALNDSSGRCAQVARIYAVSRRYARPELMVDDLELVSRDDAIGLRVRVKPKARRTEIIGVQEGALVVSLAAPPHEGQANRELLRYLSELVHVPVSRIELAAGASGKTKLVRFHGAALADIEHRLLHRT
jgi:uncharacterized protein (TIGR00251 family)